MDNVAKNTVKSHRSWFRFRLRTLLIAMAMLSLLLAWVGWELREAHKDRVAVNWVEEHGGSVIFYPEIEETSWWTTNKQILFGMRAHTVSMINPRVSDLSPLADLKQLQELSICSPDVSDISPLFGLKNLKKFYLDYAKVTDEQMEKFKQALPDCEVEY